MQEERSCGEGPRPEGSSSDMVTARPDPGQEAGAVRVHGQHAVGSTSFRPGYAVLSVSILTHFIISRSTAGLRNAQWNPDITMCQKYQCIGPIWICTYPPWVRFVAWIRARVGISPKEGVIDTCPGYGDWYGCTLSQNYTEIQPRSLLYRGNLTIPRKL